MSKRSLFWGQASGKLGEAVFYRAGGEQRTRAYVKNIKNPKSLAQMKNRILMNNVVSAFRSMKPILSVSFPMKAANQSGFNAFVKANKNVVPYAISKEDVQYGGCMPYRMFVSQGDIPINTNVVLQELQDATEPDAMGRWYPTMNGLLPNPAVLQALPEKEAAIVVTPQQLYTIMTANGNPLGLPAEFKVTILGSFYGTGANDAPSEMFFMGWKTYVCRADDKARIIEGGDALATEWLNIEAIPSKFEDKGTEDEPSFNATIENLALRNGFLSESKSVQHVWGVIVSWTENGKQRVTTSRIQGGSDIAELVKDWEEGGFVYDQILNFYGYSEESLLATK